MNTIDISLADIHCLLTEESDCTVEDCGDHLLLTQPEIGLSITASLDDNVLFFTAPYATVASEQLGQERLLRMLAADNGISTSFFQISQEGSVSKVTLNAYAVLQDLGAEDRADISSVLDFLIADIITACRSNF